MRRHISAVLFLALAGSLLSCKNGGLAEPPNPTTAEQEIREDLEQRTAGPSIGPRSHGVPHSTNIDFVTVSPDGDMALSRDTVGGLRFWASLDGSAEPLLVPIRGAVDASLAKSKDGTIITVIDASGALHILRAALNGSMQELYMGSPHSPQVQALVAPGGDLVVTLSRDYRVALISVDGKTLSHVQQRRFRPTSIRFAENRVIAVESSKAAIGRDVMLRSIALDTAKKTLVLTNEERELARVFDDSTKRLDVSPDGKHVAFLGQSAPEALSATKPAVPSANGPLAVPPPSAQPELQIVNLASGATQTVKTPFDRNELVGVSVAFHGDGELIFSSRPHGGSWRVALGDNPQFKPLPSSVANDTQNSASAVAKNTRVAADGTWLFVQNLETTSHYYLGYSAFNPQHASLSPDGEHVAWSTGAVVYVESLKGNAKPVRIAAAPTESYFRAGFIDDKHLVAVDYAGGLHLIDWRSGEKVATMIGPGPVRELEIDQSTRLVSGVQQNGGSWVAEVSESAFLGHPYLIEDGGRRSGILGGGKGVWSISGASVYRTYSLAELRAASPLTKKGVDLSAAAPGTIDRLGRYYTVRSKGRGSTLSIGSVGSIGGKVELDLEATPFRIVPSPDGTKLALLSGNRSTVEVARADDARRLWSRTLGQGIHSLHWSEDSAHLAVTSDVGSLVQSADTGALEHLSCGPWFEKRPGPPPSTTSFLRTQSLCEQEP